MNTAQQIKAFSSDISEVLAEATRRGYVTQNWDNETTEFDFPDGSVMIVWNSDVWVYGSR
jgi:hypothetical protein